MTLIKHYWETFFLVETDFCPLIHSPCYHCRYCHHSHHCYHYATSRCYCLRFHRCHCRHHCSHAVSFISYPLGVARYREWEKVLYFRSLQQGSLPYIETFVLQVFKIDSKLNLLYLRGDVPGNCGTRGLSFRPLFSLFCRTENRPKLAKMIATTLAKMWFFSFSGSWWLFVCIFRRISEHSRCLLQTSQRATSVPNIFSGSIVRDLLVFVRCLFCSALFWSDLLCQSPSLILERGKDFPVFARSESSHYSEATTRPFPQLLFNFIHLFNTAAISPTPEDFRFVNITQTKSYPLLVKTCYVVRCVFESQMQRSSALNGFGGAFRRKSVKPFEFDTCSKM